MINIKDENANASERIKTKKNSGQLFLTENPTGPLRPSPLEGGAEAPAPGCEQGFTTH